MSSKPHKKSAMPDVAKEGGSEKPWYQISFDELSTGFNPVLEPHWLGGDLPEWVTNALREVVKTVMPVAQLGDEIEASPRMLGGVLGHQIAAWNEMVHVVDESDTAQKAAAAVLIPATGFPQNYPDALGAYANELADAMKRVCGRAIEADYDECVEFFEAFTRGMKTAPSTTQRTNTGILLLLVVLWKKVEAFGSVRELHDWLCSVLNPQTVGSLKRVEKMCQRIGLTVRGKGRPKKAPQARKFRHRKG